MNYIHAYLLTPFPHRGRQGQQSANCFYSRASTLHKLHALLQHSLLFLHILTGTGCFGPSFLKQNGSKFIDKCPTRSAATDSSTFDLYLYMFYSSFFRFSFAPRVQTISAPLSRHLETAALSYLAVSLTLLN